MTDTGATAATAATAATKASSANAASSASSAIAATHWLQAWDDCAGQPPALAALRLLRLGCPQADPASLAALSPGRRDALLLDLRQALFGPALACTASCPVCAERLEFGLDVADLRACAGSQPPPALQLEQAGRAVSFRLPTALDMARAASLADAGQARAALIAACIVEARADGVAIGPAQLPDALVERIAQALEAADPQAATTLALACPGCAHRWQAGFDIAAFLCRELDAWAQRLLLDVHLLALRYGWTEADVLALSPTRRRAYLELVDG